MCDNYVVSSGGESCCPIGQHVLLKTVTLQYTTCCYTDQHHVFGAYDNTQEFPRYYTVRQIHRTSLSLTLVYRLV